MSRTFFPTAIGLSFVALAGLVMFWLLLDPIPEPDPRNGPIFLSLKDNYQISFAFLSIIAGAGWLIVLLSWRQRSLARIVTRERIRHSALRFALCLLGIGWTLLALYGAINGPFNSERMIFLGFALITPLGIVFWHLGFSTRERDDRLRSHKVGDKTSAE